MRQIIASQLMTLDGYFEGPNKEFVPPPWNAQLERFSDAITDECDTILYGRISYEMNRRFWEPAASDPNTEAAKLPFAHKMNALPKIVFSRTLPDNPGWNARVIRDHVLDEVLTLKRQPGKAMVMFGSANLMETFVKHDLIDEYRFMLNPLLLGGGAPLFRGEYKRMPLRLVDTTTLDNGVVLLRYQRVR